MMINELLTLIQSKDLETFQSRVAGHTLQIEQEIIALKSQGANINPQDLETGLTILHLICAGLLENSLLSHFEAHHIVNPPNCPLIRVAAESGNIAALNWLLNKGQNINIQDDIGNNTPLHRAVESGQLETVKVLLENGADVTIQNEKNETALWQVFLPVDDIIISDESKIKIMELLIQHGSNVNHVDNNGTTLIEYALNHQFQNDDTLDKFLLLLLSSRNVNIPLDIQQVFSYFGVEENINRIAAVEGYEKHKILAGYNLHKALTESGMINQNQDTLNQAEHVLELTRNYINTIKPHVVIQNIANCNNTHLLRDNELKCEKIIELGIRLEDFDQNHPLYSSLSFLNHIEQAKTTTVKRISEIFIKNLILPELPARKELVNQLKITTEPAKALAIICQLQASGMKEVLSQGVLMHKLGSFLDPESVSNFSYTNKNPLKTLITFPDQDQEALGTIDEGFSNLEI